MKVKFFAYFRDYTKCKETDVKENFNTVYELLKNLCNMYGKKFSEKIFNGEELSNEVIILVNGRHIVHMQGLNTALCEEDVVSIFPVVAGG